MTSANKLQADLSELLKSHSKTEIEDALREVSKKTDLTNACTILINKGLHAFPEYLFRGEIFVFYEGAADISSSEALTAFATDRDVCWPLSSKIENGIRSISLFRGTRHYVCRLSSRFTG